MRARFARKTNMIGGRSIHATVESRDMHATNADRTLDAREIDGEPFGDIVAELDALREGETLLLVNSFEPTPLFEVLSRRGFAYEVDEVEPDEWHVAITHD